MARPDYGADPNRLRDLARSANDASEATRKLDEADKQLRVGEEETGRVERGVGQTRSTVAASAREMAAAIEANASALGHELEAMRASVGLLERQLMLRREIARTPVLGGMVPAAGGGGGGGGARPTAVAGGYPEEDPQVARARYQSAVSAQAAREAEAKTAAVAYTASLRPKSDAGEGQRAQLLEQREAARENVAAARQETAAARQNVRVQEQIAEARATELAEIRATTAQLAMERRTAMRPVAAFTGRTGAGAVRHIDELEAAAAANAPYFQPGHVLTRTPGLRGYLGGSLPPTEPPPPLMLPPGAPPPRYFGTLGPGPGAHAWSIPGPSVDPKEAERLRLTRQEMMAVEQRSTALAGRTREVNQAFQESAAVYSQSSLAMTRHGALTTEFIQAFARGQVTVREFSEQMTSTIGKFAGWTVAAAAVYGVYEMLKHVTEGAKETQAAVQQLGRFIPGLGGPAGGGTGQIPAATTAVRDLSKQFNLPIKEVVDPMQVMARTYHDLPNAANATRAVLAAVRLDQVPLEATERYLTGIGNSLGFPQAEDGGKRLIGVINSLNALQSTVGARVSETLPAVARAAPIAIAQGLSTPDLEALSAMGVRAGITGPQVGTALYRSMANFAFRSSSMDLYRSYGIKPQMGQYGDLMSQVMGQIDTGRIGPKNLRDVAVALAGPLQARTMMPMLIQEVTHPGAYQEMQRQARSPRNFQEDLSAMLGGLGERFRSIGISLENFGSRLFSAGITAPVIAFVDALRLATGVVERVLDPITSVVGEFNRLPTVIRDVIGGFVAWQVAQRVANSGWGVGARGFLSRLPGPVDIRNEPGEVVKGYAGRMERDIIPLARNEADRLGARSTTAEMAVQRAEARRAGLEAQRPAMQNVAEPQFVAWNAELKEAVVQEEQAIKRAAAAKEAAAAQSEVVVSLEADLRVATDKHLTWEQRAAFAAERGAIATETWATEESRIAALAAERMAAMGIAPGATARPGLPVTTQRESAGRPPSEGTGAAAPGPVAGAMGGVSDEAVADRTLRVAEAEQPGFIASRFNRAAARARASGNYEVQNLAGPLLGSIGGSAAIGAADRGLGVMNRLGGGMVAGIPGALGTAFQGIFAAQMLNAVLPGGVGNAAGGLITAGSLGMGGGVILNSVLSRFGVGRTLGGPAAFGIGAGLSLAGSSNPLASIGGTGLATGLIASFLGASAGPLALGAMALRAGSLLSDKISPLPGPAGPEQQRGAPVFRPTSFLGTRGASDVFDLINPFADNAGDYGDQRKQYEKRLRRWRANQTLLASIGTGGLGTDQVQAFGEDFQQNLSDAFTGGGDTAKQAQQSLQRRMATLTANLKAFGEASAPGQNATRLLQEAAGRAVAGGGGDPTNIDQYAAIAEQANQGLKAARDQTFQLANARARTGQDRVGALQSLIGAEQRAVQVEYTDRVATLQQQLGPLSARYNQLLAQRGRQEPGSDAAKATTKKLNQVGASISQTAGSIAALRAGAAQDTAENAITNAQNQVGAYSAINQDIDSSAALAQARAGGNRAGQLRALLNAQRQKLQNARANLTLNPEQQANELNNLNAQIAQTQQQQTQQGLTEMQSRATVREARVPSYDAVGAAKQRAGDLKQQYDYMTKHKDAFDPADVRNALASVIQAKQAVLDAESQYAIQMADINASIQSARDVGDAVRQANDTLQGALQGYSKARGPVARGQARQRKIEAQNAVYDAQTQAQDNTYALSEAQAYGDSVTQAHYQQARATYDLSRARGPTEQTAALQEMAAANAAMNQAQMQRIQAMGQLASAQAQGDPVRQAAIALQYAHMAQGAAHGIDQQIAAQTAVAQAEWGYHEAQMQLITDQANYAASLTREPLGQLAAQIRGATQAVAAAKGPQERRGAQTNLNNLHNQYESELISERESTIDFQLQMQQITSQQAINQLNDLLKMRGLTRAERQQIMERVRQLQMGDGTGGQFDLAPGNIKMPTVYDVSRAMRGAHTALQAAGSVIHAPMENTINVYVRDSSDVAAVADAIDRTTGSRLRARLRSTGLRGS